MDALVAKLNSVHDGNDYEYTVNGNSVTFYNRAGGPLEVSNFVSGTVTTFPKFVYTASARGIPAQANVIGSSMFFIALFIVIAGQLAGRRKKVS